MTFVFPHMLPESALHLPFPKLSTNRKMHCIKREGEVIHKGIYLIENCSSIEINAFVIDLFFCRECEGRSIN